MKDYRALLMAFALSYAGVHAQTVNKGDLYISSGSLVSSKYVFENVDNANFRNNGTLILEDNLINNGAFFDYKGNTPEGTTLLKGKKVQILSGNSITTFNNLELVNPTEQKAFDIQSPVVVVGQMTFNEGIAHVDEAKGSVTFLKGAAASLTKDNSHIQGQVDKEGDNEFIFPIGDQGFYRKAIISAPEKEKDLFVSKYSFDDAPFFKARANTAGVIEELNTKEYWLIDRTSNTESDIILTLTWDERTTPAELLKDPVRELHIVRWDEKLQIWVDEGGIVDVDTKSISTPTSVKGYGFFTLATVNKDWLLDGDVVIYNLVSANGDGKNDFFRIDNIERFPNNTVEIFNRWGVRVYETTNYNSRGNVFVGKSDGRGTISKGESLPTGTYYYVITYEYKDDKGSRTIKKAGYLHLETN
ncbi:MULTISPECIES: gliding motility-associated C-terminal domain-containing protein [Myroides]|uniref:T9SS type B sorting domain-containing protein n=1 Tax=Myroides albus TaxID=2562892 RepID=A0A6I3LNB0_9FLAO|nr:MULTISPECIES: gliding motility-associated C-terminal domain-containing protein [Myroides]MTG97662.1 T9SS type B sorting domain-containing protein [Myroides albus]MVX34379.1 T9SS type B sorting domain-containing protein [Myroides sp. LoEW2-1]UVD79290.1 gliding motility-associated C-terminal domain-containing protein [Myroides albus]